MKIKISENNDVKLYDAHGNEKEVVVVSVLPECEEVVYGDEYTTNMIKIFGMAGELGDNAPYIFVKYDYPDYLTITEFSKPCYNVKVFPNIDDLAINNTPVTVSLCGVVINEAQRNTIHVESVQMEKGASLLQLAQDMLINGHIGTYRIHKKPSLWEVRVNKEFNAHYYGRVWNFDVEEVKSKTCYTTCNNAVLHPSDPNELGFLDVEIEESFDYEEDFDYEDDDDPEYIWF